MPELERAALFLVEALVFGSGLAALADQAELAVLELERGALCVLH